ncbi:MAG: FlgD immunoglobulin-like domain containing protein [Calditrichia bacterium]
MKKYYIQLLLLALTLPLFAQTQWPWPVTPFNSPQYATGTFAEYRSTSVNGHFHSGTDIPKADGSPVFPVKDGVVVSLSSVGSSAFVRVDDIAYVHILPNGTLSIGDSVFAQQTPLGTILPGLGHVHFTNGFVGSEKNSMLPNIGLTPLEDPWAPKIRFIRFFQDNTDNEFSGGEVSGLIDIVVKVDEQNNAPGSSTSQLNNGAYRVGYKILAADSQTIVIEPPNNGVKFQFDTKPNNGIVNTVFKRSLSSTTSHTYQVTNSLTGSGFWNASALPETTYVVMAFAEDTRGNTDTLYQAVRTADADLEAPAQPSFRYLREAASGGLEIAWNPSDAIDLLGYRLYFSFDNLSWDLFKDENVLTSSVTDTVINQVLNRDVYFRLTAVDDAPQPNESVISDVYGLSNGTVGGSGMKVLVVDGFDRIDGEYTLSYHDFVFDYASEVLANGFSFDSAPNESVENGVVSLGDYAAVVWFLGDESTSSETFSSTEQMLIKTYLEAGGNMLISGSRVAWDLDPAGAGTATADDQQFLNAYLKSAYAATVTPNTISDIPGRIFSTLSADYSQTGYPVPEADAINQTSGGIAGLAFSSTTTSYAATYFEGNFGQSSSTGRLVYLSVPWETMSANGDRSILMSDALSFLINLVGIEDESTNGLPQNFALQQNYPNPFNPTTTLSWQLPETADVTVEIYNAIGQRIETLISEQQIAGKHQIVWNARSGADVELASGIYIVRMQAVGVSGKIFNSSRKALLLR